MRSRLFILFLVSVLVISAACGGKSTALSGTFIEGTSGGEAETLNWILAADASSLGYAGQTLDSLRPRCLRAGADFEPDVRLTTGIRNGLSLHRPRPCRHRAGVGPGGGDVPGADYRNSHGMTCSRTRSTHIPWRSWRP